MKIARHGNVSSGIDADGRTVFDEAVDKTLSGARGSNVISTSAGVYASFREFVCA